MPTPSRHSQTTPWAEASHETGPTPAEAGDDTRAEQSLLADALRRSRGGRGPASICGRDGR